MGHDLKEARQIKKPRHVHGFIDRHGKPRFYFRRPGFKSIPLPGLPWSPDFMAAYEPAANSTTAAPPVEIGAKRIKPGTVAATTLGYFVSLQFTTLADGTRERRRRLLSRFCKEHGANSVATLSRPHVERILAGMTAASAMNFLVALRGLVRYAIDCGLRKDDPTIGVRAPKFRSEGFYAWTEQDIAQFEAAYPIGTRERLAFALLLYTAQRRSDVIQMGRQHVRDGAIHIRQRKTGVTLAIPLHPELKAALDAAPADNLTFLTTKDGNPFHRDSFTHWFGKKCREAGLPQCLGAWTAQGGLPPLGRGWMQRQRHRVD